MKKILIEVKPNSAKIQIEKITDLVYKIKLTAPAQDGKANKQLIEVLTKYFQISKSQIEIKNGINSRTKIILIFD